MNNNINANRTNTKNNKMQHNSNSIHNYLEDSSFLVYEKKEVTFRPNLENVQTI